eukprot:3638828-Prymnesium_polylepis.2
MGTRRYKQGAVGLAQEAFDPHERRSKARRIVGERGIVQQLPLEPRRSPVTGECALGHGLVAQRP